MSCETAFSSTMFSRPSYHDDLIPSSVISFVSLVYFVVLI